jgi:ankyrin repeat protein
LHGQVWENAVDAGPDHGSPSSVVVLLEKYALNSEIPTVDPAYEQGRLGLLFAVYNNDVEALRALLTAGTDPNARNEFGRTPLMLAVELGYADVATSLLAHGADVHARETDGNGTALHVAADARHADCARVLLVHGAETDARDNGLWTPLICAAFASSAATVRLLLEHGADIHAEDADGDSALSQAGWLADEETICTLLKWGPAPRPKHLRDAFYAAFIDNNSDKAHLFIEAGLKIGLSEVVTMGDIAQVKRLLADAVDQDEINRAFVIATDQGSSEIVRVLLDHGAEPSVGNTP